MNNERRESLNQIQGNMRVIEGVINDHITALENMETAEKKYFIGLDSTSQRGGLGWAVEDGITAIRRAADLLADFDIDKFIAYIDVAKE